VRTTDSRVAETRLRVVDGTQPISMTRLGETADRDASGLTRFVDQTWSLPTFSQTHATHQGGGAATGSLARSLRALAGKFTVVNRRCDVALPHSLRRVASDPDVGRELADGAAWVAVALHEPANVLVRHASRAGTIAGDAAREVEFFAALPYRLTIFAGHGRLEEANAAIADESTRTVPIEASEGIEWFRVGLCLPDAEALRQMAEETAHFYRWITGRLGGTSREQYWHLDAWEQYTEHGRVHGLVVPEFLRQERLSSSHANVSSSPADDSSHASRWAPLTRAVDRRPLVPPGYCFIEFTARVSLEVRDLR
jgi:hypothetical protein